MAARTLQGAGATPAAPSGTALPTGITACHLFYTADDLAADLPAREWTILTRAARPRAATTPDGTPVTIHDTVLTARHTR